MIIVDKSIKLIIIILYMITLFSKKNRLSMCCNYTILITYEDEKKIQQSGFVHIYSQLPAFLYNDVLMNQ